MEAGGRGEHQARRSVAQPTSSSRRTGGDAVGNPVRRATSSRMKILPVCSHNDDGICECQSTFMKASLEHSKLPCPTPIASAQLFYSDLGSPSAGLGAKALTSLVLRSLMMASVDVISFPKASTQACLHSAVP
jgi:hypothetical protein